MARRRPGPPVLVVSAAADDVRALPCPQFTLPPVRRSHNGRRRTTLNCRAARRRCQRSPPSPGARTRSPAVGFFFFFALSCRPEKSRRHAEPLSSRRGRPPPSVVTICRRTICRLLSVSVSDGLTRTAGQYCYTCTKREQKKKKTEDP